MPLVNIMVNNRAYTIACDDGEEDHLKELAAHVDTKAREVLGSVGQVGDARLLLMSALVIADDLADALAKLHETENELAALKSSHEAAAESQQKAEKNAAETLECAASRLEAIAGRLAHA